MAMFLSTTPSSLRSSLLTPINNPSSSSSSSGKSRLLNFYPGINNNNNNIAKMRRIKCESSKKLEIGSPIIMVEAPKILKTAASVPCLRANSGLVNPGDVGRIVSRKPKDVWAVRLTSGNYLIDAKYFKPLELDDN